MCDHYTQAAVLDIILLQCQVFAYLGTQYAALSPLVTGGKPSLVRVLVIPQDTPISNPSGQTAGE